MTWLWIPHASSWSSTYECVGLLRTFHPLLTSRFTFQHLPAFVFCLFCVVVWFCCFGVFLFPVFALLCFWFLFCKCLGIPNSPRSLDLDDRQGLIARSAMQQKKRKPLPMWNIPEEILQDQQIDLWGYMGGPRYERPFFPSFPTLKMDPS